MPVRCKVASMNRGNYRRTPYALDRGMYGGRALYVGRELTDDEIRDAVEAGNRNAEPLIEDHTQMMRAWTATKPLGRDQMTTILQAALKVAKETEKHLVETIAKVPAHWETLLRREGGLQQLRQGIAEAPKFEALLSRVIIPTVVPGFRDWIGHLLGRSESALIAIGAVSDILPDWLRLRAFLAALHRAAINIINGSLGLAGIVGSSLPAIGKVIGIAALVLGGMWGISKLTTAHRTAPP